MIGRIRVTTAVLGILGSCGYTQGFDPTIAAGARTVAVQVVRNDSFRQKLERPLNREIYDALATHTGLVPAANSASADVVLSVRIHDILGQSIVRGGRTPLREGGLVYQVEVELRDARSGTVLRRAQFDDRAEFRTPIGETETTANREAAFDMARRIVLALDEDF